MAQHRHQLSTSVGIRTRTGSIATMMMWNQDNVAALFPRNYIATYTHWPDADRGLDTLLDSGEEFFRGVFRRPYGLTVVDQNFKPNQMVDVSP
jgi:hypothetical protein